MDVQVIAINGCIGSGKNTLAQTFIDAGYVQLSFAESLKDAVSVIFGWDRGLLEGDTLESRQFRDTIDPFWSERMGYAITPRHILQYFGTDVVRKHFSDSIWIDSVSRKIYNLSNEGHTKFIITDCRFPNEIEMIRSMNGTIIEIQKTKPEWYEYCVMYNNLSTDEKSNYEIPSEKYKIHSSEYSWVGINKPEYVVTNTGTKEDLFSKAEQILASLSK